jgi:aminoglycoside N3'-acetyltransferase
MRKLLEADLINDFTKLGIIEGDTILIRASLGAIGRIDGGAETFINSLLKIVGINGTIVSLAFTSGSAFIKKPRIENAFDLTKESYAGALPNAMIKRSDSFRSSHPMCSYVAIGISAQKITENHDENSLAYEPIRKIIQLNGKSILIGCVDSSPGFTTTHLAEADLGLLSLSIFPKLRSVYYKTKNNDFKIFRRSDPGLCSNSFYKFYAFYVRKKILTTGYIGNAYSVVAPSKGCYEIEYEELKKNNKINICESNMCFTCNAGRWDRIHYAPGYLLRIFSRKINKVLRALLSGSNKP